MVILRTTLQTIVPILASRVNDPPLLDLVCLLAHAAAWSAYPSYVPGQ
ncbi:MAG TPA: hypothetical protein VFG91_06990 [Woeseiaceae bacterium]|nr:hypothetical protein [Woeseiaceae bacterium]